MIRYFIFRIFPLILALSSFAHAQVEQVEESAVSEISETERLENLAKSEATAEDWQWAARNLADKTKRSDIRIAIISRENYPREELVTLLADTHLAVRLGALELLEEAAGNTYGFNPWASPDGEGADAKNSHALEMWRTWAGNEGKIAASGPILSPDQMQGYIRDLISGNADRNRRAVRMLEPHDMKGVTGIQDFLTKNGNLPENSRLKLKEAQYHLVLARTAGENSSVLARDLTLGNRDQRLGALSALKQSGLLAIPIVRDFLGSDDPLVRETAVDTILTLGGARAVPLVAPFLKKEKDANVIHAAMRRFREIGGTEVMDIIAGYLDYDDEDLVVSAIESLTKLSSGDSAISSFNTNRAKAKPTARAKIIIKLLDDPRWRIRSAVLDYVAKTRTSGAEEKVVELLSDDDEFVRAQAIEAAVALNLAKARGKLEAMFLNDDEMIAPATKALTGMKQALSDKLVAHLDTRPADIIVAAIRSLDKDESPWLKIVARYAASENLDVSCAALRSLANEEDKLKFDFVANHLTAALQSGVPEKISAVLDSLDLPTLGNRIDPALMQILGNSVPGEKTTLDPLYDAFLTPFKKATAEKSAQKESLQPAAAPEATGGIPALTEALAKHAADWTKPESAFRAALLLAKAGEASGIKILAERVATLSTSERAAIAEGFYNPRTAESLPLLQTLMRDDLPQVRSEAAEKSFSHDGNAALIAMALAELENPEGKIEASEMYSYYIERAASNAQSKRTVRDWCKRILADEESDEQSEILALILMRSAMTFSDVDVLEPFTRSANQWVRRAAWYSLGKAKSSWLAENSDRLVTDPSPRVREVLPWVTTSAPGHWQHYFSDSQQVRDGNSSSSSQRVSMSSAQEAALRKMAENDSSEVVRFESWFALLSQGKAIDLDAFIQLISKQPKESEVADRIADHLENSFQRMGKGMKALLAYANMKEISKSKLPKILEHFASDDGDSFSSFSALAKATETKGLPQFNESAHDPAEMSAKRKNLLVVVFHKPGCKECEKVERYLEDMKRDFPLMKVEHRNILDQTDILVNRALCDRFGVSGAGKTPALFTQAGAAIVPETKPEMISKLLQNTMELPDDPTWNDFGSEEIAEAKVQVEETFANITTPLVIGAGLLDGINPCAFATIIFFLSYLQVARRSPREILMVGASFILAIFLTYFAVGLVFHSLVEWLNQQAGFLWVKTAMTYVFAAFALLVAVLSLRDAVRARRGNLQDMTLQLPSFLKKRIQGVIRKGARARNFVIAAFISGVIISLLELACTGQVYAPIIFKIQQGSTDAIFLLFLYNLAFILPLVIIFILAYRGMTSDALIRFQQKHTAAVKIATAVLFFLLAAVILLGDKILPH